MNNQFKDYEKTAFIILLIATVSCAFVGFYELIVSSPNSSKWLGSSGLLATIAGVVQLEVSGLFKTISDQFFNEDKNQKNIPSYITRRIIEDPDRSFSSWVRYILFFNLRTAFWLIIIGTFIQIVAVWL